MTIYNVEIIRSIAVTVQIEADDPQAAVKIADHRDFPLPVIDSWEGLDGYEYVVYDKNYNELHRET